MLYRRIRLQNTALFSQLWHRTHINRCLSLYTHRRTLTMSQLPSVDSEKDEKSNIGKIEKFEMWDCHCHMTASEFDKDIDTVLKRASDIGISTIVAVAETIDDCEKLIVLQKKYPKLIQICAGMHPCQADLKELPKIVDFIEKYHTSLIGIGEVGLDYSLHIVGDKKDINREAKIEIQKTVFKTQIQLANKYNLPLNVHSRSAGHHTITFLENNKAQRVLLHAFDGKPNYAEMAIKNNESFYFSIPPSIERSPQKQKLVSRLPIERLCLETDAPALPRQKDMRNEPSEIVWSRANIAKLKNLDEKTVARKTTENAVKLFSKA